MMKVLLCCGGITIATLCAQNPDVLGRSPEASVALDAGLPTLVAGISLVASGGASNVAYAVTGLGELFRGDDHGASWRRLDGISNVVSVVASGDPSVLYAASFGGFFRSTDRGETWTAGGPQPGVQPTSIAADPSNPAGVYVLMGFALFKSGDRGVTFSQIYTFTPDTSPGWVGVDPVNSSNLYVSMINGGAVYKSADGGQSFAPILPSKNYVQFAAVVETIAIDPNNSSILYGGVFTTFPTTLGNPPALPTITGAISKSIDGGQTWRMIQNGIPPQDIVRNVVVDPSNSNRLFASFGATDSDTGGVLASTDAGETWTVVYSLQAGVTVSAGAGVVYAAYSEGVSGGVAVSVDGGATWNNANRGLDYYDLRAIAGASSVLYSGGSQGLFKTSNSGADWAPLTLPQSPTIVRGIAVDPTNPNTVYVTAYPDGFGCEAGVFKSADGGTTWNALHAGWCQGGALVIDSNHPQTLFLVQNDVVDDVFTLLETTDGGGTWNSIWSPGTSQVTAFAIDPENSNNLYAALQGFSSSDLAGLFKSSDGGATWNPIGLANAVVTAVVVDPSNSMTLYAAESQTVAKSSDGGATWSDAGAGLENIAGMGASITSLIADPAHPGVLYLGSSGAGTYRSANFGQTWTRIGQVTTGLNVGVLSIVSGSVYAATMDGVLRIANPL